MSRILSEAAASRAIPTFPGRVTARWRKAAAGVAAALAAVALLAPASAQATTVRLGAGGTGGGGAIIDGMEIQYLQSGFTWQGSVAYCCYDEMAAYLHDDSGISTSVFSSVDGYRFDALDFSLSAYSRAYRASDAPRPPEPDNLGLDGVYDPYPDWAMESRPVDDDVGWYGMRNGIEVARYEFREAAGFAPAFDGSFSDLDSLVLRQLLPEPYVTAFSADYPGIIPGGVWCREWCGGIYFYGLTLDVHDGAPIAPVPLPAGGLLLLSGLTALVLRRRRKG